MSTLLALALLVACGRGPAACPLHQATDLSGKADAPKACEVRR